MPLTIYGLEDDDHALMPVNKLFRRVAEKTQAVAPAQAVEGWDHHGTPGQQERQNLAARTYEAIEKLPHCPPVLMAEQVMTTPVVTLTPEATISEAMSRFRANNFRHVPVISPAGLLAGIVSERDILRYLAGISTGGQSQPSNLRDETKVAQVMTPRVLTASMDTDVRYIARLFVEHGIGAVPVVQDHALKGIITRRDVLAAVMRHYVMELWA